MESAGPELANVAASFTSHLPIDLTELVRDVFQRMGNPLLSFRLAGSELGLAWVEVGLEKLLDSIFHSALLRHEHARTYSPRTSSWVLWLSHAAH
jgi:hypothetical protein